MKHSLSECALSQSIGSQLEILGKNELMLGPKRVLIIDDHPICIDALKHAASQVSNELTMDACLSAQEAYACLPYQHYDALFLDLSLPDASGVEALAKVRAEQPNCAVAVVSANLDQNLVQKAMSLGCRGYIPKSLAFVDLVSAVTVVLHGGTYFSQEVLALLASDMATGKPDFHLSKAQTRVMRAVSKGLDNGTIAAELGIDIGTVKSHLSGIYKALGVRNRNAAILAFSAASETQMAKPAP